MRIKSETSSIRKLAEIREAYRAQIERRYEFRAKDCGSCETPGACCLDAHFVNVRITRLEARAMRKVIDALPDGLRSKVNDRIEDSVLRLGDDGKYACPLYEKGTGCLGHRQAKPIPCISHACYEREEDLPPSRLQDEAEAEIDMLNTLTYGSPQARLAIPIAIGMLHAGAGASPFPTVSQCLLIVSCGELLDLQIEGHHQHCLAALHSVE